MNVTEPVLVACAVICQVAYSVEIRTDLLYTGVAYKDEPEHVFPISGRATLFWCFKDVKIGRATKKKWTSHSYL